MDSVRQTSAGRDDARPTGDAETGGPAGAGVVPPEAEAEAIETRVAEWHSAFRPFSNEGVWLLEQAVVSSIRIDRCRAHESVLRADLARRAALCWDDDRRLEAEKLASGLARSPARVSRALAATKQGCEWLLSRWRGLGEALDRDGTWTGPQSSLALDLLGTPAEFRGAPLGATPAEVVAREVDRLERRKADALDALDAHERSAAALGLEVAGDRSLARLRRYEAACARRYQWARCLLLGRRTAGEFHSPVPDRLAPRSSVPAAAFTTHGPALRYAYEEPLPYSDPDPLSYPDSEPIPIPLPIPLPIPPLPTSPPPPAPMPAPAAESFRRRPRVGNRKSRRAAGQLVLRR